MDIVVVGQIARDLVVVVDELPESGSSATVRLRKEMLGGKGANIAVGAAQLGAEVAVVGALGDDAQARTLLDQLDADGVFTACVRRGPGTTTGLIVDVLTRDGSWRYLEDLPEEVLVTAEDVAHAGSLIAGASSVVVQLQQPAGTVRAAAECARSAGARVVFDGKPPEDDLLALADVLRADHHEAELLIGRDITGDNAVDAARELMARGPSLVALAVEDVGNVFVWEDRALELPLVDVGGVVDTTGGGDAFTAALTCGLTRGDSVQDAARHAVAAACVTVGHAGGRPSLSRDALAKCLAQLP